MITTGLNGDNYFKYTLDLLYLYGSGSEVCDRKKKRSADIRNFSLEFHEKVLFYNLEYCIRIRHDFNKQ